MYRVEQALNTELGAGVVGADGQQYRCADALARKLGCVPLNMFGPDSITRAAGDYIRYNKKDKLLTEANEYAFNVSNVTLLIFQQDLLLWHSVLTSLTFMVKTMSMD